MAQKMEWFEIVTAGFFTADVSEIFARKQDQLLCSGESLKEVKEQLKKVVPISTSGYTYIVVRKGTCNFCPPGTTEPCPHRNQLQTLDQGCLLNVEKFVA